MAPRKSKKARPKPAGGIHVMSPAGQVNVGASVMPDRIKRTLNYASKSRLNAPDAGVAASIFFSANGLYDPDRTLVGHQPMGFDQLMPFYDHYVVTHAKITLIAMSEDSSFGRALNQVVTISARDTTTATGDITQTIESGRAVFDVLGTQNGRNSSVTLSYELDVAKYLGRDNLLSDPQCKGSVSSDPAEEVFFEINAANLDSSDPSGMDMLVLIQYTAWFMEPKRLTPS